jgi:hypothetical protein
MTKDEFHVAIQRLFHEANVAEIDIGDIYHILHGQALIAETILKLSIEKAYKDRWY